MFLSKFLFLYEYSAYCGTTQQPRHFQEILMLKLNRRFCGLNYVRPHKNVPHQPQAHRSPVLPPKA